MRALEVLELSALFFTGSEHRLFSRRSAPAPPAAFPDIDHDRVVSATSTSHADAGAPSPAPSERMRILLVNYGYPPLYSAGSEIYTQTLGRGLADAGHDVLVFAREEDPTAPDYGVRAGRDARDGRVAVRLVNHARSNAAFADAAIDAAFDAVCAEFKPDVVHFGHLNHLSVGLPAVAKARGARVLFTLHDFWLMCPRGQFLKSGLTAGEPWAACEGQRDERCAADCFNRLATGLPAEAEADAAYWTRWVGARMAAVLEACRHVDCFVAPAASLAARFRSDARFAALLAPPGRLAVLDYGFDLPPPPPPREAGAGPVELAFLGRLHPSKGLDRLLRAFGRTRGDARLRIWGAGDPALLAALRRALADPAQAPPRRPSPPSRRPDGAGRCRGAGGRVEVMGECGNEAVAERVLAGCDALVVPSVWDECSPLVIHEVRAPAALSTPLAAAAEALARRARSFSFRPSTPAARSSPSTGPPAPPRLARPAGRRAIDLGRDGLAALGARGYLHSADGGAVPLAEHVRELLQLYRGPAPAPAPGPSPGPEAAAALEGPWRVTLDTNPDDCNLHCEMCECFSPHSDVWRERLASGRPPRRASFHMVARVLEECAGRGLREVIPSTMGEPLLWDGFPALLALCARLRLKLNLTTNGTFPGRGAEAWARDIVPVASDIKARRAAARGPWPGAGRRATACTGAAQNLRTLLRVRDEHAREHPEQRCTVTLQCTFMEGNLAELPALVRLAADLGVDRVKGHHLWAHFGEIAGQGLRTAEAAPRWNAVAAECRALAAGARHRATGLPLRLDNFDDLDPARPRERGEEDVCPFLGREAWVSAEGRFDPCCAPDAERAGLGYFGNVADGGLLRLWGAPVYRRLVADYRSRPLCRTCTLRRPRAPDPQDPPPAAA
eukprot:tig00000718_g3754.t1